MGNSREPGLRGLDDLLLPIEFPTNPPAGFFDHFPDSPTKEVITTTFGRATSGATPAANNLSNQSLRRCSVDDPRNDDDFRSHFTCATEIGPPPSIRWVWEDRLPQGEVTLIEGRGATGKSTIALDIAARVTTGRPMPHASNEVGTPSKVILLTKEDSREDTVADLVAAGANLSKVLFCNTTGHLTPQDFATLCEMVVAEDVRLIVIDPLKLHLRGSDKDEKEVQVAVSELVELAHETGAAVIGIRHWKKGAADARDRGAGSVAYFNTVRAVLTVGEHSDAGRVMAVTKQSKRRTAPTISFEIVSGDSPDSKRIEWCELQPNIDADSLSLAEAQPQPAQHSRRHAAEDAIRKALCGGPRPASGVVSEVQRATDYKERSIQRIAEKIGVKHDKSGFQGATIWSLPEI